MRGVGLASAANSQGAFHASERIPDHRLGRCDAPHRCRRGDRPARSGRAVEERPQTLGVHQNSRRGAATEPARDGSLRFSVDNFIACVVEAAADIPVGSQSKYQVILQRCSMSESIRKAYVSLKGAIEAHEDVALRYARLADLAERSGNVDAGKRMRDCARRVRVRAILLSADTAWLLNQYPLLREL